MTFIRFALEVARSIISGVMSTPMTRPDAPTFFAASYWVARDILRERRADAVIGSNL